MLDRKPTGGEALYRWFRMEYCTPYFEDLFNILEGANLHLWTDRSWLTFNSSNLELPRIATVDEQPQALGPDPTALAATGAAVSSLGPDPAASAATGAASGLDPEALLQEPITHARESTVLKIARWDNINALGLSAPR